jgi:RecB family exonuclease
MAAVASVSVEQPVLGGMPQPLYMCTPARLTAWLDCPRRYRMAYLERPSPPKGPPWAHHSVGVSVHAALAAWWRAPRNERTVEGARSLLRSHWVAEGFRDDEQDRAWRERVADMVERYVATLDPHDEPLGVERTVAFKSDLLAFHGRVDRIDAAGEELVVVDYKTGRHVLSTDDARGSLALALYALASARTLRRACRRVELHHLPTGTVVTWEHSTESLDRHVARAEDLADECARADGRWKSGLSAAEVDEVFPPRPGAQCRWCDYARHCPEGQQVGPSAQPWDALPAD